MKQDFYFLFDGGVKVFRLPVGSMATAGAEPEGQ